MLFRLTALGFLTNPTSSLTTVCLYVDLPCTFFRPFVTLYIQGNNVLKPLGCDPAYLADEVDLHWPSRLALSPVDGSLYIVDENQVLRLTADMRLELAAGLNLRCRRRSVEDDGGGAAAAVNLELGPIIGISFGPDGQLYLAENRGTRQFALHR